MNPFFSFHLCSSSSHSSMSHFQTPSPQYRETNPHFITQLHPQGQPPQQPPQHHVGRPQQQPWHQREHPQQQPQHYVQSPQQQPQQQPEHFQQQPQHPVQLPQQQPQPQHQREHPQQHPQQHPQRLGQRPQQHPQHQGPHTQRRPHSSSQNLLLPPPRRTRPLQWFLAIFCAIFWVLVILGGLIVLIIYLVYRPQSPRFDLSSVTLNAAYLDMGYLLNADVTMLANFTNPNKKVGVDFSYVTLNLYYENTLIATRYVEPFSSSKKQSRFADIHMVTSQVRLPVKDIQRLKRQIQSNKILFQVKGFFRTRSKLGSFLRYSYWLYAHCSFVVTGPPSGILVSKKCRTKR